MAQSLTLREATGRVGLKFRLFPLIPALSHGEREEKAVGAGTRNALRSSGRLATVPPLPKP
jgi:hypothetical protein